MPTIQDSRILIKSSTVAGVEPTIPESNDHTDGTWLVTDLYKGELFINQADGKVFTRTEAGILQIYPVTIPSSGSEVTDSATIDLLEDDANWTDNIYTGTLPFPSEQVANDFYNNSDWYYKFTSDTTVVRLTLADVDLTNYYTKSEVDDIAAEVLSDANDYSDSAANTAESNANSYTDVGLAAKLNISTFNSFKPSAYVDGDLLYVDSAGNLKSTGIQSSNIVLYTSGLLQTPANSTDLGFGQFAIQNDQASINVSRIANTTNQESIGLDVNTTFSNGGFTGTSYLPFRIRYNSSSIFELSTNITLTTAVRNIVVSPATTGSLQVQLNQTSAGGGGNQTLIRFTNSSSVGNVRHYHITGGNTASYFNVGVSTGIVFDVNPSAVAPTALVHIGASASGRASLRMLEGVAVTSPNNGEMWVTTSGIFARSAGVTLQLSQTASANQAAINDSTTGTPSTTLVDVGVVFNQGNINNNFASLNRQVAALRQVLINSGLAKGSA